MVATRIIPRLDIKGPNLVKGIHLEGLRTLGTPDAFAQYYYESGADELLFIDAVASLYGRNSLLPVIERTARQLFIPLTVGGGLRTLDDMSAALNAGADKVAINTAAVERPALVAEAAEKFGTSTVVVGIDAKRRSEGGWTAFTGNGRDNSHKPVVAWAREVASLGAGEILLTSIDREGTGQGFDVDLTREVAMTVDIPVIACGGAGRAEHVRDVLIDGKADAVGCASILHYNFVQVLKSRGFKFSSDGDFEVISERRDYARVVPTTVQALKHLLTNAGIEVRIDRVYSPPTIDAAALGR